MPPLKSIEMKPEKHGYGTIFTKSQFCAKPQYPSKTIDLSGKVAIVTGSNTGLGLSCCRQLLNLKLSHLILAVRSIDKGDAAANQLRRSSPSAKIEVWELEMGSYDSILAVSCRTERLQRLDIAVLNAGIIKMEFHRNSTTGHEDMVQVNYLSTMLLATLLLPTLKTKSPQGFPGRLTIVGPSTVFAAKFKNRNAKPLLASFDSTSATPWDPIEWYPCSKLLGHLFLVKLVDYVNANDVIVNIVDPGYCKGSQLHREATGVVGALVSFSKTLTASLEVGASTYIDAAVVNGKKSHGCWLMDWKIKPFVNIVYEPEGPEIINRLWDETMEELSFAKALDILRSLN